MSSSLRKSTGEIFQIHKNRNSAPCSEISKATKSAAVYANFISAESLKKFGVKQTGAQAAKTKGAQAVYQKIHKDLKTVKEGRCKNLKTAG